MDKQHCVEILAPAGNAEMLHAAVLCGANAVYLGIESFNARRTAGNFTIEALQLAVAFCRARGVKVYVALNTTLYPQELPAVAQSIRDIAAAGADAVIVQDLAMASLVRQMCPTMALHGSTQMSVHSLSGAKQLAEMGFSRVILSRELSLAEIAHITAHCGIETEVFVHGALCMSVSGQCYMSAFLGGRSGNRGGCAGPCRLPFSAGDPGLHHLSLKDMSHIEQVPQLAHAGVASIKIEGRLRTAEYAAAAVNACVQALEGGTYDAQLLQDVFSRSGFTSGYLSNTLDGAMFGTRTGEDSAAAKAALPKLRELFRRERACVGVAMALTIEPEGGKLTVTDTDGNKAIAYGSTPAQPAEKDPTEAIRRTLSKTGGTPFYPTAITVHAGEANYLPAGELGEMRRSALEQLLQKRSTLQPHPCTEAPAFAPQRHATGEQRTFVQCKSITQMPQSAERCNGLILPLAEWEKIPATLRPKTWLALPRMLFGAAEDAVMQQISASKGEKFAGYFVQNIAHVFLCKGLPMLGGFGLNITNPLSAAAYAGLGLHGVTLSPELTLADMACIAPKALTMAIAYGHMPLMVTRACPLHNVRSCAGCLKKGELLDRKGKLFPVRCSAPAGAGVRTIYNPIPIYMGDRSGELPVDIALVCFDIETKAEAESVLQAYHAHRAFAGEFTRGLYYKGTN